MIDVQEAEGILAGRRWTAGELQRLTARLKDSLTVVRRVAESRGAGLPVPDDYPADPGEPRRQGAASSRVLGRVRSDESIPGCEPSGTAPRPRLRTGQP